MRLLLALLCLCILPLGAQERSLRWPDITVTAHLDADGRLSVRERQTILLSGDWNGPERRFSVPFGQRLTLLGLTRSEPGADATTPLVEGDLSRVDEYRWSDGRTLRWRSRLPSDPPFDGTTLVYTLELRYEFILQPDGDGQYRLAHDFAFADRGDRIDRFSVSLTLDDVWQPAGEFSGAYSGGPLEPGEGFVVNVALRRRDASRPASMIAGAPQGLRLGAVALLAAAALLLMLRFFALEQRTGRFAAGPDPSQLTREWMEQHVLAIPPEVAGLAWDDTTAAPEVAATIARMIADGQLESSVQELKVWKFRRTVLQLRLLVPRQRLSEHDRILIDALFPSGKSTTDTDAVRERYKKTGFDPARLIQPHIRLRLDAATGLGGTVAAPSRWPTVLLLFAAAGTLLGGIATQQTDVSALPVVGVATAVYGFLALQAGLLQARVLGAAAALLLRLMLPTAVGVAALAHVMLTRLPMAGPWAIAALALLGTAFVNSLCNIARSRHDATRIAVRQRLAAARERFRRELATPQPALLDAWYPWVLAFGLGHAADRWFRAFGAEGATRMPSSTRVAASSFGGGKSGGWTGFGGGGGFAGGGSSGSFAAAIGGMAASVPAPSSSSSGGGGGGRSGGGGGGGW